MYSLIMEPSKMTRSIHTKFTWHDQSLQIEFLLLCIYRSTRETKCILFRFLTKHYLIEGHIVMRSVITVITGNLLQILAGNWPRGIMVGILIVLTQFTRSSWLARGRLLLPYQDVIFHARVSTT